MYTIQTKSQGNDLPNTMPLTLRTPLCRGLSLRNYHVRNGWVSRLVESDWVERIGGFDLLILAETKITDKDCFCRKFWYDVV